MNLFWDCSLSLIRSTRGGAHKFLYDCLKFGRCTQTQRTYQCQNKWEKSSIKLYLNFLIYIVALFLLWVRIYNSEVHLLQMLCRPATCLIPSISRSHAVPTKSLWFSNYGAYGKLEGKDEIISIVLHPPDERCKILNLDAKTLLIPHSLLCHTADTIYGHKNWEH